MSTAIDPYFKDVGTSEVNEKRDARGRLAIHVAAGCSNNLSEVKRLLSIGADIHSRDKFHNTPLHEAAKYNRGDSHFDIIKMLLELGTETNHQNQDGSKPLHLLIRACEVKTVNLLLDFGADVNIKDNSGETPFSEAVSHISQNLKVMKLLLDHGSDVNNSNKKKYSPLHHACRWNNFRLIQFLVKNGASVNSLNSHGRTPLTIVLEYYGLSPDLARFLIQYSDVNTIDSSGKNVLCIRLKDLNETVWKTIVSHIAKLQSNDLPVHQNLLETMSNRPELQEYFEKCTEELLLAKSTKLKGCSVTFYNLLLDSKIKLKYYAGNRDLVQDFKNSDRLDKFPIYGVEMIKKVEKGIQTRKSFDKSSVELSYSLPIFNPRYLIIKDVLDCLTYKDYNQLISEV